MRQIELIILSGEDQQGLISGVMDILANYGANILDISESVIHSNIILGILVDTVDQAENEKRRQILSDFVSSKNLSISFSDIDFSSYAQWVQKEDNSKFILTMLARKISAKHLSKVAEVIYKNGLNIDEVKRLSGRVLPDQETKKENKVCIEFSLVGELDNPIEFRRTLLELSHILGIDLAFQEDNRYRRNRRVVVFDMDSTLIETEVIDELAEFAGVGQAVKDITYKAMSGEIDFEQSLRERVLLLKDLPISVLETVANRLPVTEGAYKLLKTLRMLGYKTAIISGGFSFFADKLRTELGIDYVFGNTLEVSNGKLTGYITGEIIDGERKAKLLRELSAKEGLSSEQVIAVGDGANDIAMLSEAGLGIAFKAKPKVIESAQHSISQVSIDSILYLLGIADRHHSSA